MGGQDIDEADVKRACRPDEGLYERRNEQCSRCKQRWECQLIGVHIGLVKEDELPSATPLFSIKDIVAARDSRKKE